MVGGKDGVYRALDQRAVRTKAVGLSVDLHLSGRHQAVFIKVIGFFIDFFPAGRHFSRLVRRLKVARPLFPLDKAGQHPAGIGKVIKEVVFAVHFDETGQHFSACVKIVPLSAVFEPAGFHCAIAAQEVPAAAVFQPAGLHCAAFAQEVPVTTIFEPAGVHRSVFGKMIPCAVDFLPIGKGRAGFIIIIAPSNPPGWGIFLDPGRAYRSGRHSRRRKHRKDPCCQSFIHQIPSPIIWICVGIYLSIVYRKMQILSTDYDIQPLFLQK